MYIISPCYFFKRKKYCYNLLFYYYFFNNLYGNTVTKMSNCMAVRRFFANHCRITTNLNVFTIKQRKVFTCAKTTSHFVTNHNILVRIFIVYIVYDNAICVLFQL